MIRKDLAKAIVSRFVGDDGKLRLNADELRALAREYGVSMVEVRRAWRAVKQAMQGPREVDDDDLVL